MIANASRIRMLRRGHCGHVLGTRYDTDHSED